MTKREGSPTHKEVVCVWTRSANLEKLQEIMELSVVFVCMGECQFSATADRCRHSPVRGCHRISRIVQQPVVSLQRLSSCSVALCFRSCHQQTSKLASTHRHWRVDPLHIGFFDEDLSGLQAELFDLRLGDVFAPPELLDLPV